MEKEFFVGIVFLKMIYPPSYDIVSSATFMLAELLHYYFILIYVKPQEYPYSLDNTFTYKSCP